jgi:hypothetical protein
MKRVRMAVSPKFLIHITIGRSLIKVMPSVQIGQKRIHADITRQHGPIHVHPPNILLILSLLLLLLSFLISFLPPISNQNLSCWKLRKVQPSSEAQYDVGTYPI